jgi:hypothetical protein
MRPELRSAIVREGGLVAFHAMGEVRACNVRPRASDAGPEDGQETFEEIFRADPVTGQLSWIFYFGDSPPTLNTSITT